MIKWQIMKSRWLGIGLSYCHAEREIDILIFNRRLILCFLGSKND